MRKIKEEDILADNRDVLFVRVGDIYDRKFLRISYHVKSTTCTYAHVKAEVGCRRSDAFAAQEFTGELFVLRL